MAVQNVFKRYEVKFMLDRVQYDELKRLMSLYMDNDEYGNTTICNIYYDTDTSEVIRRSMEKPVYKEKLRIRSYGPVKGDQPVFVELKKKYQGIVYKRRISVLNEEIGKLLEEDETYTDQISREIRYYRNCHENLHPAVFISYDREAFYMKDNHDFRMTFDQNIRYRDYDLDLSKGVYGDYLTGGNQVLLEVKTASGIPLWLSEFLSKNRIYKTSFSKYGEVYKKEYRSSDESLKSLVFERRREYTYAKYI